MHTITIDPFAIIVDYTEKDTKDSPSHHAFSSEFIKQVTHKNPNSRSKLLQISLKITEKHEHALMQCNWIQAYKYIQRIQQNIDSLDDDYVNSTLPISWMEAISFKKLLINELFYVERHIEENYLARIDKKITAYEIQQINSWLGETETKSYYKICKPKNKNKRKHVTEKDISGTFHEEKTALQKYLLQQGYLHELVRVANATFKEEAKNAIVAFLENCSTLLTSSPETYRMTDQWLPKTKITTGKNQSKLDSEFESKISLIQSKATESLNEELELVNQKLDEIIKLLSLSSNIGSYLSTFDVRIANIISKKIKLFKNRIDTIQSLRETCTEDHEKVSIIGLTRLLVEDVNIQHEHLNNVINRNLDQVIRTRQLLSRCPSNGKFLGKTITQLDKNLEATQTYISHAQQTTTKITSQRLNSEEIKILNENIKASIEITDIEKRLTDLSNVFSLCSLPSFSKHPKYIEIEETNNLLDICKTLLDRLEHSETTLSHQAIAESYQTLSKSLVDFINLQRPLTAITSNLQLPFKTYIRKLLLGEMQPLQALTDPDTVILYKNFCSFKDCRDTPIQSLEQETHPAVNCTVLSHHHKPTLFSSSSERSSLPPISVNIGLIMGEYSSGKLPSSQKWVEYTNSHKQSLTPTSVIHPYSPTPFE